MACVHINVQVPIIEVSLSASRWPKVLGATKSEEGISKVARSLRLLVRNSSSCFFDFASISVSKYNALIDKINLIFSLIIN
ncbi:hypothetical protein EZJ58_2792 [Sodalis ligni]|jgi:hypothetical protein|uniref:Uncharacterized protein n=1 Tax=Sodalis ligni TaxID=2697027 RepID=A0A4R1NFZ0_9GAMM|nr:hypothetical protein EZJ58_2792 [Sodalis ligni]